MGEGEWEREKAKREREREVDLVSQSLSLSLSPSLSLSLFEPQSALSQEDGRWESPEDLAEAVLALRDRNAVLRQMVSALSRELKLSQRELQTAAASAARRTVAKRCVGGRE